MMTDDPHRHKQSPDEGIPEGEAPELTRQEARQGKTLGAMRYVLMTSMALGLIGMFVVLYFIVS